ncbi:MAG: hypothetical protein K2M31_05865 [Muribaculaceae bacterium]|nr:hypothetical protein [Muribaculaceae bacterium]
MEDNDTKTEQIEPKGAETNESQTLKNSSTSNSKKKDDDDFSWGGCLFVLVLIIAALWALIHFNPSEEKHTEAIAEVYSEALLDGFVPSGGSLNALNRIKYHSLGICSWTTTKYMGHVQLTSVGALGYVYPLVHFSY